MQIRSLRHGCLTLSLLLAYLLPMASAEKFGNLTFNTPPGWSFNGSSPTVGVFTPMQASDTQARMLMLPVTPVQGEAKTWFETVAQQLSSDGSSRVLAPTVQTPGPDGQEQVFLQGRVVTLAAGQQARVILAVIHQRKAAVMVLVGSTPDVIKQYQDDLVQLAGSAARSLTGQSAGAKTSAVPSSALETPPRPAVQPGSTQTQGAPFSGVYAHWNADPGGSCGGICWSFLIFQKGGQVFTGNPPASLTEVKCPAKNCEPYRVQGNQLTIGDRARPWRQDGQKLMIDGLTYHPITPYNNLKLSGTYRAGGALQIPGLVTSSSVRKLTFSPGGQFTSSDNTGTLSGPANAWSQQAGGGTYRINGHTLELHFHEGTTKRGFFFVMPGNHANPTHPGGFYFDGNNFLSED